jgi:hypothetical protein
VGLWGSTRNPKLFNSLVPFFGGNIQCSVAIIDSSANFEFFREGADRGVERGARDPGRGLSESLATGNCLSKMGAKAVSKLYKIRVMGVRNKE